MPTSPEHRNRVIEPALWLFCLALVIFGSRARLLWADGHHGWLWPFALWLAVIVIGAVVNRQTD